MLLTYDVNEEIESEILPKKELHIKAQSQHSNSYSNSKILPMFFEFELKNHEFEFKNHEFELETMILNSKL